MHAAMIEGVLHIVAHDLDDAGVLQLWAGNACPISLDYGDFGQVLDQLSHASEVMQ